jgi:hypothetical protein
MKKPIKKTPSLSPKQLKQNTKLSIAEQEAYNKHKIAFPEDLSDNQKYDYDVNGFYQSLYKKHNGDYDKISKSLTRNDPSEHLGSDKFKKSNHPTFSNESKYAIPFIRTGGSWEEGKFIANKRNIKNMQSSYGSSQNYMNKAEDYNKDGISDVKLEYKNKRAFKADNTGNNQRDITENKPFTNNETTLPVGQEEAYQRWLRDNKYNESSNLRDYWKTEGMKKLQKPNLSPLEKVREVDASKYPSLDKFYKDNTQVAGMNHAPGEVSINPYSNIPYSNLKNVIPLEKVRDIISNDANAPQPNYKVTKQQHEYFKTIKDNDFNTVDYADARNKVKRETIASRVYVGDEMGDSKYTNEQKKYADSLNKYITTKPYEVPKEDTVEPLMLKKKSIVQLRKGLRYY